MKQELIGGLVLCLIGLGLFFVLPVTLWTLTEKWKTQDGERPTKESDSVPCKNRWKTVGIARRWNHVKR